MNGTVRFIFTVILIVILTACAAPAQILSTLSPSAEVSKPIQANTATFKNILAYDSPKMYKVVVETVQYPTLSDTSNTLPMYIFYPPDRRPLELLPAVIMVNGFPNSGKYKGSILDSFQSWGHLIASYGLIAVAFDSQSASDLDAVVDYIRQKGADVGIDGNKIGLWAAASSAGLASSYAFQGDRNYLKFVVLYYPWIMTPDNYMREELNAACFKIGCLGAQLPDVEQLRNDLPVLVVRCGRDTPDNIAVIDHFTQIATEAGVPLTLVNFDEGHHSFDQQTVSEGEISNEATEIIKQTLEFMKEHASNP
jgi:dienelactone hydrolase